MESLRPSPFHPRYHRHNNGLYVPGQHPFNPGALGSGVLAAYWNPANLASLTLSGSDVTAMADQSGNGKNLLNATGTNRMQSGIDTINGRNVLTCAANLGFSSLVLGATSPCTIMIVLRSTSNAGSKAMIGYDNGTWAVALYRNTGTNDFDGFENQTSHGFALGGALPSNTTRIITFSQNGASSAVYRDVDAQSATGINFTTTAPTNFRLGDIAQSDSFIGQIGPCLVWTGVLNTTDRNLAQSWLAGLYL